MVFLPVIFTKWEATPTTSTVELLVETSVPTHLRLTHSYTYPVRTPRFIRRYGYTRECGFFLRWINYTTNDQVELGDTTQHHFIMAAPTVLAPSWGAVAPSSHPLPKEPATPPIPIPASAQQQQSISLVRLSPLPIASGATAIVPMELLLSASGWPAPPPPLPTQFINSPPTGLIIAHAELGIDCPAAVPVLATLTDASGTVTYQALAVVQQSGTEFGYSTIAVPPQPGGSTFAIRVTNTSNQGLTVGLFQRTPQLSAFTQ